MELKATEAVPNLLTIHGLPDLRRERNQVTDLVLSVSDGCSTVFKIQVWEAGLLSSVSAGNYAWGCSAWKSWTGPEWGRLLCLHRHLHNPSENLWKRLSFSLTIR